MLQRVRIIADYQFGRGTGIILFPDGCEFILSKTGRIRQVTFQSKRLATVRAGDGRLTLGIEGARRLHESLPKPVYRVVISRDVEAFVAEGKNAFARHIVSSDEGIRPGDEVLVVSEDGSLVATGMAVLSGTEMLSFNYGVAVKVRQGRS